jgi:hypothetical protein
MKIARLSLALAAAVLLTASTTRAEFKRVEMTVFGMD